MVAGGAGLSERVEEVRKSKVEGLEVDGRSFKGGQRVFGVDLAKSDDRLETSCAGIVSDRVAEKELHDSSLEVAEGLFAAG